MKPCCLCIFILLILTCAKPDPYELWKDQPNQKIIFSSRVNQFDTELYRIDKDGTTIRLTFNDRVEKNPSLSPDGQKVVYSAGSETDTTSWELYILDLSSLIETRLTSDSVGDTHPDWSPDGRRIVFVSYQDMSGQPAPDADICLIDANGSGFRRLTSGPALDDDPDWSPAGDRIAFKSTCFTGIPGRDEICIIDTNGNNLQRLTVSSDWQSDHDPAWSPDGQTIVFCRYTGARCWIEMTDINFMRGHWRELIPWNVCRTDLSGKVQVLTDAVYAASLPLFSSDGRKVLYNQWDFMIEENEMVGIEHRLILMNPDGTDARQMLPYNITTKTIETFDW